ncbi:hypothetical protein EJD97_015209 [Solanum chilense]|uniref:Bet v I/Major latex protein domain-containing protein n=1 Tax=Solanum chilense TaxID=4083 RepID=A0A6N2B848_SOLCI|nr:hypothetical protein EJD97_015209 [Solanum chilense]
MGLKGKLMASIEVKCGGHEIHDIFHTNADHIPTISRALNRFEIHEGEIEKIGSIISWNYNDGGQNKFMKKIIEDIDPHKKSIRWKIIGGDLLEMYSSFTIALSCEPQWVTWTIEYEKKFKDTPVPLNFMGITLDLNKDIEDHLVKN